MKAEEPECDWCREQGMANGTVNRDLAALRRAFTLGLKANPPKLQRVPTFPRLKESDPRSGFVEEAQYREMAKRATPFGFRALLATGYTFGFRRGELSNMRVRQVNLANRSIQLDRRDTKNKEPRLIKLTDEIYVLLQACVMGMKPDDFVFRYDNGRPFGDFRPRWEKLCIAVGLGKYVCPVCSEQDERGDVQYFPVDEEGKCPRCDESGGKSNWSSTVCFFTIFAVLLCAT
jgi:integrase